MIRSRQVIRDPGQARGLDLDLARDLEVMKAHTHLAKNHHKERRTKVAIIQGIGQDLSISQYHSE